MISAFRLDAWTPTDEQLTVALQEIQSRKDTPDQLKSRIAAAVKDETNRVFWGK